MKIQTFLALAVAFRYQVVSCDKDIDDVGSLLLAVLRNVGADGDTRGLNLPTVLGNQPAAQPGDDAGTMVQLTTHVLKQELWQLLKLYKSRGHGERNHETHPGQGDQGSNIDDLGLLDTSRDTDGLRMYELLKASPHAIHLDDALMSLTERVLGRKVNTRTGTLARTNDGVQAAAPQNVTSRDYHDTHCIGLGQICGFFLDPCCSRDERLDVELCCRKDVFNYKKAGEWKGKNYGVCLSRKQHDDRSCTKT